MAQPEPKKQLYTYDEYLAFEETSETKHEFYQGELFDMAGTSSRHNEISCNTALILKNSTKNRSCKDFMESLKLELLSKEYYVYPDIILTCHPDDIKSDYVMKFPSVIVEVLSKVTSAYDSGMKMQHYMKIATLKYYLLVSQEYYCVEVYERKDDLWLYKSYTESTDKIILAQLNIELLVADVYENVTVTPLELIR